MLILGLGFFGPRPAHAVSPTTCASTADFDITPDPSTLTLPAGSSGVSIFTVTPVNGFNTLITLAAVNVATGLTVTLSAPSIDISAGPTTFTATVKASSTIATGVYSFGVNATTGTTLFHESTTTVQVPIAELGISPSKSFVIIPQGSSDSVTINLESLYGLPASTVALTKKISTGLPSPIYPTVTLSYTSVPLSLGGTATSTLSIITSSASPATTPGEYSIEVNGTASPGNQFNTTKVTVDVTAPTFFLFATPSMLKIPAGSTAHSTINATSVNSFSGTVVLTSLVLPPLPGITATPIPSSVSVPIDSYSTSDLKIDVGASVIPGTYEVLVTGMSGLISGLPAYVFVTVPGKPDFSITGSPSTLTVPQTGATSSSTIILTSLNGFADTVDLSISCSNGLTADISPASVTLASGGTGSATLTVSAYSFTVPGNYTVSIFGIGTSIFASNYTSIDVRVTGPDFSLSATPTIVYLTAGGTAISTITATSKAGFSGSIRLEASVFSLTGPGLATSLSKTILYPTGSSTDSAILTLTATATGKYAVEITGTSWPLEHKTGLYVEVTTPTPDFSLTASPTTLTILHGTSKTSTIGLSPLYGFTGTVALSATGPTGITASPSPVSISGTATSSLTVNVASSVAPGSYTVDVAGTSGTLVHHAAIVVTVTSAAPTPDFGITATSPVSFTSGTTGTSTVIVNALNGFYAYVTLTASAPSGLTVAFSPTAIYPGTSTATLSSSTPGSYTVTITGTSGSLVHTATVQVSVTAVGTPDFTITRDPATLTIQAGNSGTSTITIAKNNNFAGTVSLTATVSPSGPTTSLSTSSISGGSGTATITINVASSVGAGTYTVTVQGTSGSLAHSTQVTITVTSAPSTQPPAPAAPAPTILGLTPLLFYGIIGGVIVLVIAGVTVVIRSRNSP